MNTKPVILVVGATGMVGGAIIQALLTRGETTVKAMVRATKPQEADKLKAQGIVPVEGDLLEPATLPKAVEGVDVIIAAVPLGEEHINVEGQKNLLAAAEQAGVKRFFPSDYSVDYFKLDDGDNFNLDMHKRVAEALQGSSVRPTHVLNGMFTDFIFDQQTTPWFDAQAGTFSYYGDGEQLCDFTTVADTAAYIAAAAVDPDMTGRKLKVAGDVLSPKGVAAAYEQATGRQLTTKSLGSIEELRALIAEKQQTAKSHWDYVGLQYQLNMVSGKGKLDPLDNNRYPQIRLTTVEEFVRQHLH